MHQMRISTTQVSSVVLRPKKLEIRILKNGKNCKRAEKKPNTDYCQCAMKLSQIPRRIELRMKFTFFLDVLFIFVFLSK
jgi:hypothetical protein